MTLSSNMPNDPLIEEYVEKLIKGINTDKVSDPQWLIELFRTSLKEYGDKRVGKYKEELLEATQTLKVEEAPPFSASDTFRNQAELINKHLMPAIKERFISLITQKQ